MKRIIALKLSLILLLFCSGCANQVWTHDHKGTQEFYQNYAQCEAMSNSAGYSQAGAGTSPFMSGYNQGAAFGAAASRERILNYCMQGEGWYLTSR